ncbi:hypothetical protein ANN_01013 [Periplaneta americana]|uniref:DUF4371 domain-containing protein n=1 Tax=Periplaneta americana TaxID=6978 RepID=A0ABQ8TWF9_PERAM|nr:hypothetical protein ANN_01013 [Periplaneta americana]
MECIEYKLYKRTGEKAEKSEKSHVVRSQRKSIFGDLCDHRIRIWYYFERGLLVFTNINRYKEHGLLMFTFDVDGAYVTELVVVGLSASCFVSCEGVFVWCNVESKTLRCNPVGSLTIGRPSVLYRRRLVKYFSRRERVVLIVYKIFNENVRLNRNFMKVVVQAVIYLAKQELPFRGHDEQVSSHNRGNFKELLQTLLSVSSDEVRNQYNKIKCVFSGESKTIQNELIECISDYVCNQIKKEVNETVFFIAN